MNAPKTPDAVLQLDAELVPVDVIIASSTHIQQSRRKRFSEEAILELAASIATSGVINPILLRPFPEELKAHITPTPKYELVAGERRWLATKRAGLAHIPAVIRNLDDGQVLEAQLVENLQRENLSPLEEAEGYQELKQLKGYDALQIGELIGKSKSYVYARMKLNELVPEVRDALASGKIDFSKGLLIARFSPKLQAKAFKAIGSEYVAYRDAFRTLRHSLTAELPTAPFAHDDASFFRMIKVRKGVQEPEELPACVNCPSNSANDTELHQELAGAHVCTDRPCFEIKVAQFWDRKVDAAKQSGKTVLVGEEATAAVPRYYGGYNDKFVDLDAECEDVEQTLTDEQLEAPERTVPTFRELLKDAGLASILAQGQKGQLVELVDVRAVAAALKPKGIKLHIPGSAAGPSATAQAKNRAELAREEERRKVEIEYRGRLLREIHARFKGPLKRPDLERIAHEFADNYHGEFGVLDELYPDALSITKAKDEELMRYIVLNLVADETDNAYAKPAKLLELAERFKIDHKAIRARVVKDLKPTSAPPEETPKPEATTKPAKKKAPAAKKKAAKK